MKTTHNIKALCAVVLLGTAAAVNAQEDVSKEKNLNREMTLEREYDPSVQDASKINTLPPVKEPEIKKMPISYSSFTVPANPEKEIGLLPSGNILTEMNYNKRRGYLNFGIGTYMNIKGDFGYHILSTKKDQLNVFLSHRSSNGKIKYIQYDEKAKAKINDNLGGINFKHEFEQLALNLGARYGYSAFNYYGLPMENLQFPPTTPPSNVPYLKEADRSTNQVNQQIRFNAGVESKEEAPVGYLLDIDFINFSHKYGESKLVDGATENTIDAKFDLNAAFGGNQKIGLGGNVVYFAYSLPAKVERPNGGGYYISEFENHAEATLSPYYKVTGDNWNIKLGANVMFVTGEAKKVMASPNITADIEVAEKTVLYLTALGKLHSNSMYEVSQLNRYINPTREITPSFNWLDATLGIKSGIAPNFWFDIFAGYKITKNNCFFVPSRGYDKGDFGNFSTAFDGIDSKQLFVGANLKYSYQQLFDINLKGVYNNWKASLGDGWTPGGDTKAYGMPTMELTAGVTARPMKNLALALDYYLAIDRYTHLFGAEDVKMKNINELNLTGTYTFNDTFGAYIKVNNLLCQKYELLYGYPMQSISAMVGVNINF
ncbi:MAG: TonB-dependent receptor [Tannerellaceae bacterium]